MDYLGAVDLLRYDSWEHYWNSAHRGRLVLLTTRANEPYTTFAFDPDDRLLVGRESAGVPAPVHAAASQRIRIPMAPGQRSLNVAIAAAIVTGEALRQTGGFAK